MQESSSLSVYANHVQIRTFWQRNINYRVFISLRVFHDLDPRTVAWVQSHQEKRLKFYRNVCHDSNRVDFILHCKGYFQSYCFHFKIQTQVIGKCVRNVSEKDQREPIIVVGANSVYSEWTTIVLGMKISKNCIKMHTKTRLFLVCQSLCHKLSVCCCFAKVNKLSFLFLT